MTRRTATKTATTTTNAGTGTAVKKTAAHHPIQDYPYTIDIDPRDLRMEGNTREVGDVRISRPELVASVEQHGLQSVVNVTPDPDGVLRPLWGFNRLAAAVLAVERHSTVRVNVVDPRSPLDQLIEGVTENVHHQDYTTAELAGAYARLALFDLDDEQIADRLSVDPAEVRAGRAIAGGPRTRAAAERLAQHTLLELEPLAEFEDDEAAHTELVETLDRKPGLFGFKVAELRNRRAARQRVEDKVAELRAQGYTVLEEDESEELPDTAEPLEQLCDSERSPLTSEAHTECPGRAVIVEHDARGEVTVAELCLDYPAHGHIDRYTAMIEGAQDELREQGVTVIDADLPPTTRELAQLYSDGDGTTPLTVSSHQDCPGHAAFVTVSRFDQPTVRYACVGFAERGHTPIVMAPSSPARVDGRLTELEKVERRRVRKNNELWRVAADVRRAWLKEFFAGWQTRKASTLPPKSQQLVATAWVAGADHLVDALRTGHVLAGQLLGLSSTKDSAHPIVARLKRASSAQAVMVALAQVLGGLEEFYGREYAIHTWRAPTACSKCYFTTLKALGYTLSPVEELVLDPMADTADWPHRQQQADQSAKTAAAVDTAADGTEPDKGLDTA